MPKRGLIVVVALIAGACGRGGTELRASQATEATGRPTECPETRITTTAPPGVNTMSNSHAAPVIGTWEAVSAPRYATTDGKPIDDDPSTPDNEGFAVLYGHGTVRVERVIFDSEELSVSVGDVLTLQLQATSDCEREPYLQFEGPVAAGDRSLLFVSHHDFRYGDGHFENALTTGFTVNWRIVKDADGVEWGRNRVQERDAPVQHIIDRVEVERKAGKDPERDKGTEDRPFGS